jgi:HEAT repeat protein
MRETFHAHVVIDRTEEAARVVEFLSVPDVKLAVLYGRTNCGKTTLVRDFVVPAMPDASAIYYGAATPDLPETVSGSAGELPLYEALSLGKTVFLDDFDHLLCAGGKARMEQTGMLLADVHKGELRGRLVLILQEENLSLLLTFRASAPDLLDNTLEILGLPVAEHIRRLGEMGTLALDYTPEVIERLSQDLEEFGTSGSVNAAEAVDCGVRHYKRTSADRLVTEEDYAGAGFLPGIIRSSLDARMAAAEQLFGEGAGQVARAIAEEAVESARFGRAADFHDIASRLGVTVKLCDTVLRWASNGGRLLKNDGSGAVHLVPRELARVLEIEFEPQWRELGAARELLGEGLRGNKQIGTLLPKEGFEKVNRIRTRLKTSEAETALLALSALDLTEGINDASYWVARLHDNDSRVSVLTEALFSKSAIARANAASLLSGFEDEEVRFQLYRKALEDSEETVRESAIKSLSGMLTEEFWPLLNKEACDASSPYRRNAIRAMRLCRSAASIATLEQIAGEPRATGLPTEAIQTLAEISSPEAVDALVRIGLADRDAQTRADAACSVASLRDPELAERALNDARTATFAGEQGGREFLEQSFAAAVELVAAVLLAIANFFLHGAALIRLRRYRWAFAFLLIEAVSILSLYVIDVFGALLFLLNWIASHFVATRFVLLSSERKTRVLGSVLFCFCMGSFLLFHGSAHAVVGQWRRALSLFVLELAGFASIGLAWFAFVDYHLSQNLLERVFYSFFWLYLAVGIALFVISFWRDTKDIFYKQFLRAERGVARQREAELLARVLATPVGTEAALRMAEGPDRRVSTWAQETLVECGGRVSEGPLIARLETSETAIPDYLRQALAKDRTSETLTALSELWDRGSATIRHNILRVFLRQASEQALDRIGQRLRDLDWRGRLRYRAARLQYPFGLWPRAVRWTLALIMPFVFYALCEATLSTKSPAHNLVRHMRANFSLRAGATSYEVGVNTAKFLAGNYPREAATEIIDLYEVHPHNGGVIHVGLRDSLVVLACSDKGLPQAAWQSLSAALKNREEAIRTYANAAQRCPGNFEVAGHLVSTTKELLRDREAPPTDIRMAIQGLRELGSMAVPVLEEIALRQRPDTRVREVGSAIRAQESSRQDLEVRLAAVDALIRIGSREAYDALNVIAERLPSEDLRQQVLARVRVIPDTDRLSVVRAAFERADYERAIREGTPVVEGAELRRLTVGDQNRLFEMLGKSNYRLFMDFGPESENYGDEAIKYFRRLIERNASPSSAKRFIAEIRNARAGRLSTAEKWKDAWAEVEAGIADDPSFAGLYGTRGAILLEWQRTNEAVASFSKATGLDPNYAWAYCMQADIALKQRDFAAVERLATQAIQSDPTYSWSFYLLTKSYTDRGQVAGAEAIARFEDLTQRYPNVYWPGRQLAQLYHDYSPGLGGLRKSNEIWEQLNARFRTTLDRATRRNHDANLLESRFTVGKYEKVFEQGRPLADELKDEPDYRMPVLLTTYASALILNDSNTAREQLDLFASVVRQVERGHKTPWEYSGTIEHLENVKSISGKAWKQPLLELLRAAHAMKEGKPMPTEVIEANRRALM